MPVSVDNPIKDASDDAFGRREVAETFVRQVLSLDASEGLVISLMGSWGSGKTSFLNLARQGFESEDCTVVEFNPWMFSGTEQLVASFFLELSTQLGIKPELKEIGIQLQKIGQISSGKLFVAIRFAAFLAQWKTRGKRLIDVHRETLQCRLQELGRPIIVLLDDLDRLSEPEIREMFKLMRLTASFPYIAYIAAFDRQVVERALREGEGSGQDYLDKIVQVPFELPPIPDAIFLNHLTSSLQIALADIENEGPFDEQAWPDIFAEIVRPLVRKPRDISRLAASLHGTVRGCGRVRGWNVLVPRAGFVLRAIAAGVEGLAMAEKRRRRRVYPAWNVRGDAGREE